ncbi:hypothetical protein [Solitalea lacus]|uniref:hypothetical protein n=1 Tax=Solitalea lacus TaxID=2911172 RepID=UPI001EDBE181|nr:hypothetical protein [Solitalea lacus]UKJ07806.1 hypothetical protein L2B55_01255 [Solitalea lacus]
MNQIKQLLRLHSQGHSNKAIKRILSIITNIVKSYLHKLHSAGLDPQALLQLEDPEVETKFHTGNPAYKVHHYTHFKGKLEYFSTELQKPGVTKKLLWEEYLIGYSSGYGYSQFCHQLHQQLVARKSTSVLQHEPGDKLFIALQGNTDLFNPNKR